MEITYQPLVSFIIAVYNEEDYIEECIKSCLDQSFKNIEICITNDCSEDKTLSILKRYQRIDNRIKIFSNPKNAGVVASFNRAYELSKGEYIAISCGDDINEKERIETSLRLLLESGSEILSSNMLFFNNKGEILGDCCKIEDSDHHFSLQRVVDGHGFAGGSLFFTRKLGEQVYPIPESLFCTDRWISLLTFTHNWKFVHNNFISGFYRLHDKNDRLRPNMNYLDYKKRIFNYYAQMLCYYNTYVEYLKQNKVVIDMKISSKIKIKYRLFAIMINKHHTHKMLNLIQLFKICSNDRDWYKAFLVELNLLYFFFLRMKLINFLLPKKKMDDSQLVYFSKLQVHRKP